MHDDSKIPRRLVAISQIGTPGGAETMLERALAAAVDSGWSVCCLSPPGPMVDRLRSAGIEVRATSSVAGGDGPAVVRVLRTAFRVLRVAADLRCGRHADVVLSNSLAALIALRVARAARLTGTARVVFYAHEVVRAANRRLYLRLGAPAVDVAFVVSEAVAQPLREEGIRCVSLPNGVTLPSRGAHARPGPPWVVGCVGVLTPWKGPDVLVEAMAQLVGRRVSLQLVGTPFPGDESWAAALERRAKEPDLAGRVEFLGWRDDPLTVMREWHVAVSPSVEPEASGLAVLEAMSIGVPLVCADHGGPREFLGEAGLLVTPGSPGALADGISRLLDDESLRVQCMAAGPRQVAAGMTADRQRQRFVELLGDVVAMGPRGPQGLNPRARTADASWNAGTGTHDCSSEVAAPHRSRS